MPIGPYKNFQSCVAIKKKEGLSNESARKYCGALQQKVEGVLDYSYGLCPECYCQGIERERRPNGNTRCVNGHEYLSANAVLLEEADDIQDKLRDFFRK